MLQIPSFDSTIKKIRSDNYNLELLISPMEKNLGMTLGNSLRRVIYGFTPGCAITSVQIKNATHEFSSVPGMKEDIVDVIVNLKSLSISMNQHGPRFIFINKQGPAIVTGHDIVCPPDVQIINKDRYICTLNENCSLEMRMTVEAGIGYVPASYNSNRRNKQNEILLDVSFCPVTHVCYHIKHFTFYEELLIHVKTNGSISPINVIKNSLSLLRNKL